MDLGDAKNRNCDRVFSSGDKRKTGDANESLFESDSTRRGEYSILKWFVHAISIFYNELSFIKLERRRSNMEFDAEKICLIHSGKKQVVRLVRGSLSSIGYVPHLSLNVEYGWC